MKKGNLSNLSVKRISTSPYFSPEFEKLEKNKIETVAGAKMLPANSEQLADILITNTHTNISTISEAQLRACKLLIHPNSGYDNLPAEFIKEASFPVIIGNPIRAHAVSNYILSALYTHYSPIPFDHSWNPSRKWPRKLLTELSILILGSGHIGNLLKSSLASSVASIQVYDPHLGHNELKLKGVDVVIPACSLNQANKHMINQEFLLQLNEDFLLINAARGGLVHTEDLLKVLAKRPRAHAILDVFEKEPADLSVFGQRDNIRVSSHVAGVYENIDATTAKFEAEVISDFQMLDHSDFEKKYKTLILKNRLSPDGFLI